jgi:hypothetical protein
MIGGNTIDSREIEERIEELDDELQARRDEENIEDDDPPDWDAWLEANKGDEDVEEYLALVRVREECEDYSSEWRHGETLIHEDYFEESMDEMVNECYDLPKDLPSFITLQINYDDLKYDYTEVDVLGQTYYIRNT